MTLDSASELVRSGILQVILISAPLLVVAIVVGLLISILQAVTQIQDQSLSTIPKILAVLLVAILAFPMLVGHLREYTLQVFQNIPTNL